MSCETINNWEEKFGPLFADKIRRNRPKPGDKWHLDEAVIKINGETFYLWRAVDQYGDVLDIMVQKRRNKKAAKRFLKKLVKQYGQPRVMITDKLRSYGAAKKEVMPDADHRIMPSDFVPPMTRSTPSFAPTATFSQPTATVTQETMPSTFGPNSPWN